MEIFRIHFRRYVGYIALVSFSHCNDEKGFTIAKKLYDDRTFLVSAWIAIFYKNCKKLMKKVRKDPFVKRQLIAYNNHTHLTAVMGPWMGKSNEQQNK